MQKNPHQYYVADPEGNLELELPSAPTPYVLKILKLAWNLAKKKIICFLNFIWNPFSKIPGSTIVFSPDKLVYRTLNNFHFWIIATPLSEFAPEIYPCRLYIRPHLP